MPFPIVPVIMAAAGLVNSIIASRSAKKQTQATNLGNMELAKYQADRNEQFVDKQNEYNSPANQMARFAAGGLNPHLIYGQGNAGNQSSPVSYQAPRVDFHHQPFQLPEILGQYQDFQMKQAQIDNVKANTQATQQAYRVKIQDELLKIIAKKKGDIDLSPTEPGGESHYAQKVDAAADLLFHQNQLSKQKLFQEEAKSSRIYEMIDTDIAKKQAETLKRNEEHVYLKLRNQMFKKQGLTPTDNILLRLMSKAVVNAFGISIDDIPSLSK